MASLEHVLCPEKTVSTADNSGIDEDLTAAEVSSISAEMRTFSCLKMMLRSFRPVAQYTTLSNDP